MNVLLGASGGYTVTLGAGTSGSLVGFGGAGAGNYGTINGSNANFLLPSGNYLHELSDDGTNTYFVLSGLVGDPGQTSLRTLALNGHLFVGSAASYVYTSATSEASWTWSASAGMANGSSYPAAFTGPAIQ